MGKAKIALALLLAFLTAVFFCMAGVCLTAATVTSQSYLQYTLDKSDFAAAAAKTVEDNLNGIAIPSGLPEDFFTGKGDAAAIDRIVNEWLAGHYQNAVKDPDTAALKAGFVADFRQYAAESGITATEEAMDSLADLCVEEYLSLSASDILALLSSYSGQLHPLALIAGGGCLLVAALCFTVLCLFKNRFYARLSLAAGGCMLLLLPLILRLYDAVGKLRISPRPMYLFLCQYANGALLLCVTLGGVTLLGALLWSVIFQNKNTEKCGDRS